MRDRGGIEFEGKKRRRRRNVGRFLAPIFLIAVIAGTYVIVHHGILAITNSTTSSTSTIPRRPVTKVQRKYQKARFYTVQPGDSLTLIAQKTGVSVTVLQRLNPKISPNTLQLGERLRLRR